MDKTEPPTLRESLDEINKAVANDAYENGERAGIDKCLDWLRDSAGRTFASRDDLRAIVLREAHDAMQGAVRPLRRPVTVQAATTEDHWRCVLAALDAAEKATQKPVEHDASDPTLKGWRFHRQEDRDGEVTANAARGFGDDYERFDVTSSDAGHLAAQAREDGYPEAVIAAAERLARWTP